MSGFVGDWHALMVLVLAGMFIYQGLNSVQ